MNYRDYSGSRHQRQLDLHLGIDSDDEVIMDAQTRLAKTKQYIRDQRQRDRQLGVDSDDEAIRELQPRFASAADAAQYVRDQCQLRRQLDQSSGDESEMDVDAAGQLDSVSSIMSDFHLDEDTSMGAEDQDTEVTSFTTTEKDYQVIQPYRRIEPIPTDCDSSKFSAETLRAAGFDESHIQLVSLLSFRGRQVILPQTWKKPLESLPQTLFANNDSTLFTPNHTSFIHAECCFNNMLLLGGNVRSAMRNARSPEQQTRKHLKAYMKWTLRDSGLDKHTALPILRIVTVPRTNDNKTLVAKATRSLTRLARKWREALQARQLATSYTVPTLYAIVASNNMVFLATLRPDDTTETLQSTASFDLNDANLDFWSSLALMIAACHARNMQMLIAEETGIGQGHCRRCQEEAVDPDL